MPGWTTSSGIFKAGRGKALGFVLKASMYPLMSAAKNHCTEHVQYVVMIDVDRDVPL